MAKTGSAGKRDAAAGREAEAAVVVAKEAALTPAKRTAAVDLPALLLTYSTDVAAALTFAVARGSEAAAAAAAHEWTRAGVVAGSCAAPSPKESLFITDAAQGPNSVLSSAVAVNRQLFLLQTEKTLPSQEGATAGSKPWLRTLTVKTSNNSERRNSKRHMSSSSNSTRSSSTSSSSTRSSSTCSSDSKTMVWGGRRREQVKEGALRARHRVSFVQEKLVLSLHIAAAVGRGGRVGEAGQAYAASQWGAGAAEAAEHVEVAKELLLLHQRVVLLLLHACPLLLLLLPILLPLLLELLVSGECVPHMSWQRRT